MLFRFYCALRKRPFYCVHYTIMYLTQCIYTLSNVPTNDNIVAIKYVSQCSGQTYIYRAIFSNHFDLMYLLCFIKQNCTQKIYFTSVERKF